MTLVRLVSTRRYHDHGARGSIARRNDGNDINWIGRSVGRAADRRQRAMTEKPLDLDKHRGMAAQKATDIRRVLAEVESNARDLRNQQATLENHLLTVAAASWPEAAAKARYVLNLYAAGLAPDDTHHRDVVAAVLADFARLSGEN